MHRALWSPRDSFEFPATSLEKYFIWGYHGTQYRVRLYPPFGYSTLYKEYYLTGLNHQKTLLTSTGVVSLFSRQRIMSCHAAKCKMWVLVGETAKGKGKNIRTNKVQHLEAG